MKILLKLIPIAIIFGLIGYLLHPAIYNGGTYNNNLSVLNTSSNLQENKDIKLYVYRESPIKGEFFVDITIGSETLKSSNLIKLDERFFILGQADSNSFKTSKEECQIVLAIGMLTKKSFQVYELDLNFATYCSSNDLFTSFKVAGNISRDIKNPKDPLIKLL